MPAVKPANVPKILNRTESQTSIENSLYPCLRMLILCVMRYDSYLMLVDLIAQGDDVMLAAQLSDKLHVGAAEDNP